MLAELAFLLTISHAASLNDKPESLRRAEEQRAISRLATARFETVTSNRKDDGSIALNYKSWECAMDRFVVVERGDEDNTFAFASAQTVDRVRMPISMLYAGDELWTRVEDSLSAEVRARSDDAQRFQDPRAIGIIPAPGVSNFEEMCEAYGYKDIRYEEQFADGLYYVTGTARFQDGSFEGAYRWTIDPNRDWSVTRIETYVGGQKIGEQRHELRQFGGVWFPAKIEKIRLAAGETVPTTVTEVLAAEFNRPEHKTELGVASIGIEPGMSITRVSRDEILGSGYWDGEKITTWDELNEQLESGEKVIGPTVHRLTSQYMARAARESSGTPSASKSNNPSATTQPSTPQRSEWGRYTDAFLRHYAANDEQRQKAESILRDCEERRDRILALRQNELRVLATQIEELKKRPDDAEQAARVASLRERLRAPITAIFEKRLKSRLFGLLTRKQSDLPKFEMDVTPVP